MIFLSSKNYWDYLRKKNTNIFVGLDFKYHMELSASGILYLERLNQNIRIPKFDSVKKLQTSSLCCLLLKYQNEYYLCLFLWLINLQKRHPPNYHCLIERRNFLVLNQHQQHPFYNFINSQIAASTYCPFCRHCLKKV